MVKLSGKYLFQRDVESVSAPTGIDRKIIAQIRSLNNLGLDCDFAQNPIIDESLVGKALRLVSGGTRGLTWSQSALSEADFLYLRKPWYSNRLLLDFLRAMKRVNPNALVLYEVPTYPYDGEMERGFFPKLLLRQDRAIRNSLKDYLDCIVDFSGEVEIFGIQTLQIINGVDVDAITPRRPVPMRDSALNIMCVAAFSKWHGIDRFLLGLRAYYQNEGTRNIKLHLVGEGPELSRLKRLTKSLFLSERVVFYGYCNRTKMDAIYDCCTIALESFAGDIQNIKRSSSLKSREYLAKGMPFVHSLDVDVFLSHPVDFCMKTPMQNKPVDIASIVAFHDDLYERESQEHLIRRIRDYAISHVSMDITMKPVADFIKEKCRYEANRI